MAAKRKRIPRYGTVEINGYVYYKTSIADAEGQRIVLYAKTREELYDKEMAALEQIDKPTRNKRLGGTCPIFYFSLMFQNIAHYVY